MNKRLLAIAIALAALSGTANAFEIDAYLYSAAPSSSISQGTSVTYGGWFQLTYMSFPQSIGERITDMDYRFDSGDGQSVSGHAWLDNVPNVTFVYSTPGTYKPSLRIDAFGQTTVLLPGREIPEIYSTTGSAEVWGPELTVTALSAAPVPEPETYAMMMAGLGLLGFAGRRRQKRSS